jgi:6-phosphogluconolactonase
MRRLLAALLAAAAGLAGCLPRNAPLTPTAGAGAGPHTYVYAGTSAGEIVVFELDVSLGMLVQRSRHAVGGAPAALAGDQEGRVLVAAIERGATAVSLKIDPATGALTTRTSRPTGGSDPARATLDTTGKYALVTHRGSANVAVLAIKPDLTLDSPDVFAAGSGAYGLSVHPSNQIAFVTNLRAGTLSQFSFNAGTGMLTPNARGSGGLPWNAAPRQVTCHPSGRFTYVLNESNDTISVHAFDDRMGTLSHMAFQVVSTLPGGSEPALDPKPARKARKPKAARAGDIRIHPTGHFLYASSASSDTVASYSISPDNGSLTLLSNQPSGGTGTDDLAVDPSGRYLVAANHKSRTLTLFRVDPREGTPAGLGSSQISGTPLSLFIARPLLSR